MIFCFKQKTAYEVRISDWSSDVCSSDLDGSETRAFCYVDDVVDGILTMWQNGETMNVYHIGAMEEVPIRHLAELVADAVGQPMELVPGEAAVGGTPRRCPDIAQMRGIGYEPKIGLAEGVARTPRW